MPITPEYLRVNTSWTCTNHLDDYDDALAVCLQLIECQFFCIIMAKVAVFPAAGKIGSSIYTNLFDLVPPEDLLLISRSPEKVPAHFIEAGVQTRKADYNDANSLEHAFDHVSCLILISYPSIENDHRFEVRLCLSKPYSMVEGGREAEVEYDSSKEILMIPVTQISHRS